MTETNKGDFVREETGGQGRGVKKETRGGGRKPRKPAKGKRKETGSLQRTHPFHDYRGARARLKVERGTADYRHSQVNEIAGIVCPLPPTSYVGHSQNVCLIGVTLQKV